MNDNTANYPTLQQFINNTWVRRLNTPEVQVLNPATGQALGSMPMAAPEDMQAALAAASMAQMGWQDTPVAQRAEFLKKAAVLLRNRANHIGSIITLEQGRPLRQSIEEVLRAAALIEWNAEAAVQLLGNQTIANPAAPLTRLVPCGPVAAFTPWNVPALSPARKISMALAAGCVCILKPAEETPGTAVELMHVFADAGLPTGVLSLLLGDPAQISDTLIRSPVIRNVTFTGSVPVGKHLAALAGSLMKPVTMELGGHNPVLILNDADTEQAAALAATAAFRNAGQICTSPTRFYVQCQAYQLFLDEFVKATRALSMGHGFDPASQLGPVINARRLNTITQLVDRTVAAGARLLTGGTRLDSQGYFYPPTILTDIPADSAFMKEEPFGPVAGVFAFDDVGEGVALCNRSELGLAAYVFTASTDLAHKLAWTLEAGVIGINQFSVSRPEIPFGGVKDSGQGREGGHEGLKAFLVTRTLV